jgi:hypothetical protein
MSATQLLLLLCFPALLITGRGVDRDSAFPGYKEEGVAGCSDKLPQEVCIDYKASRMCNTGECHKNTCPTGLRSASLQATINW